MNEYGPTETAVGCCVYEVRAEDEQSGAVAIGRAIANTRLYLLDEAGELVARGMSGELYIGGAGVARGYYQRSELTAERFVPDAYSGAVGGRLYRSGDRAHYRADGELEYLGRQDEQVKVRGYRIELGEIESVLGEAAGVQQAVVVLREAEPRGESAGESWMDQRLVAYVVARQNEPPATAELRAFLKERLPEYMVPAAFIFLSELPLTPSGKVNRRALPTPEQGRPELTDSYVGSRTETEALVCSLWAKILQIERVSIYDNFFELGGHSLLATQLMSQVREVFRVEIPLRLLFEQPTVAGLTRSIEAELSGGRNSAAPIQRLSLEGPLPLSFSQQRLWFLDQLTPGSVAYNMPIAIRLSGSLHLLALQQTFSEILRRHEVLRTSFAVIDGEPVQLVSEPRCFDLPVVDLSHLERLGSEQEVQRLAGEEAHRPFDLTYAPLFRATLLRLAAAEHVLLLTMHHIISDGWSMGVLIKEVTTLYEAFSAGQPSPLAELPVQYADYAVWQREQLQGETLEGQLQYWREQLEGAPVLLELPTDKPRPPVQSYRGAQHILEVAPRTTRALKMLSQEHGVTLFMTLLAALQVLLYRYTGQEDIVVGTPVAGRTRAETEGLIGFFLNTLALRVSLKGDPTFAALLSRVREACLGAYAHQDVPFERLLEELAPERTLSHTPIFQVMFNMLNLDYVGKQIELDGLKIDPLPAAQQEPGAKFDLEFYARELGDGLQLRLVYSELFTSVAMEQMLGHLHTLLQAVAAEPGRHLATLDLSTDLREQRPNQNSLTRPTNPFVAFANEAIEQTIQERFEKQVRSYPGNIAIKIRKESWTYKELNHKANQIARTILAASGGGEQRIALLLNHDAPMVAGILGVLKAGKTYVPLDAAYPEQRLIEVLKDSEAAGLLTDDANLLFAEALIKEGLPIINLDRINSRTLGDNLQVQGAPDSLAYILYTSGSTGQPKGVMQNHRNVLHHIRTYTNNLHISGTDKVTLFSSYAFDAAVMDIFGAVLNGATLCPIDLRTEDLNMLSARLNEEEITIYHSTPTVYRYFVNTLRDQETCPSIRLVVLGGEEVQKRDFELYRQHFSPLCLFVNGLGPTESTVSLQYFVNQQTEITHDTVPVGHAVENTEVSLFNEAGEQVAIYGVGEIVVKSPHVALGYWRRPELSQTAFLSASADGHWRSYRTGDLGRWQANGTIEYVGRRDDQVKIRGHRVELGEVEAALRTCRGISECVVVMQSGQNGSGERLVAYVVMGELEKEGSVSEWRQELEERLPQYMVPSVFMVIDRMPLTASGKVDRRALPEVEASRAELGREYEAARTETEETLVSIWTEVLNVERVGIHDNFFELGGHSLLATRMVSLVRESFSLELSLRSLFESPTVAGLGARVERMLAAEEGLALPPIERVERIGHLPLSFAQQRLWVLNQLDQGSSFFNMHQAMRLKGVLNVAALEQSLNEVLRRHEALRTRFVTVDGLPVQVIEPPQSLKLALVDLSGLTRAEQETEVLELSKEEAHHSFDLTQAPLLRVRLLKLESEEHVVLLTMHHIISDGWSIAVFIREMSALYAAFSGGMESTLAELPIQYADYAVWQRNRLHGEELASQLSYWKKQLAGAPPALDLPTDYPTASRLSQGARYSVTLPDSLVKQLKRLSLGQEATPFIILLTALKILLFRWTTQRDIVVGTVVANRDRVETENLIGCFMNFLPIRTETSEDETGLQLLRRIKNTVLGIYAHHDCPFEKIVEAANPERRPDQNPLYNVAFLLQNFPRTYDFSPTLETSMIPSAHDFSLLDLRFVAEEYPEAIKLWCEYRSDLFEAETIKQLVEGYCATLEKLASEPQLTLSSFTLPEELEARAKQSRSRNQKQTIAIAATFTAEPVEDSLDFWMQELGIPTHCAFAPFNQVFQQLLEPSSLMATNQNGVNVILIKLEDWGRRSHDAITETHSLVISPEEIERSVLDFIRALNSAADGSITPYLLCVCPSAPDILSEPQTAEFFQRMEKLLAANFKNSDGVYHVTTAELAATYPVPDYYDAERDQLGQVPYTPAFFTALGMILARKVRALKSRPYKVIVLDCDETLWKGVCGEDGPLAVEIDAPRRALQEFMLAQHEQGMLLCLCSQNNEEDVLEVFERRSEMALRPEHLAVWRINWRPKPENIKALAEELQLGLDSFIFVDNDPVVCMQMQAECPEVLTLQLPVEAEQIPKFLQHVWAFDHLKVTDADRQRTALYQQNHKRERLRSDSLSLEDFLAAIELEIRISEMSPHQLARVAQLTQRTNQFNFTQIERSESELKNLSQAGQLETLVVDVSDRFGDYGLIGVMIFGSGADAINVDTFLLSCRALGRKLEHRMLARLGMIAYERRKQYVNVRLLRTRKNQPAQDFLSQVGIRFGELSDGLWNFKFPTEHLLTLDETTAHRQEKAHAGE
ncbi:MAG: amino acid adenylation domain-containing protein [Acidobacteriota bacterium]